MEDVEQEQALLAAIRAAPEQDEPRRRFGEWLSGHGDPQGEFILVQLELRRTPEGHPDHRRLRERQAEIQRQHPGLRDLKGVWAFKRGLVNTLFVTRDAVESVDDPVLRRAAITELVFEEPMLDGTGIDVLQSLRPSACPRWLHSQVPWSEEALRRLLEEGHLRSLRCLVMNRTGLGDRLAERIAACESLSAIDRLHLGWNGIGARGASALAASPFLARVEALSLESNQVDAEGARALPSLPALARLDLSGNPLGAAGVSALCQAPGAGRLRLLRLADAGLDAEAIRILASTPALAGLQHLALSRNLSSFPARSVDLRQTLRTLLVPSPHLSPQMRLEVDGASLGLSWVEHTDWGFPVGEGWDRSPPAELKSRFELIISRDDEQNPLGPFSFVFAGPFARGELPEPPA